MTAAELVEEARDVLFETGAGFRVEIDLILAAWRGSVDVSTALALELVGGREAIQDRTCAEALSALEGMLSTGWAG